MPCGRHLCRAFHTTDACPSTRRSPYILIVDVGHRGSVGEELQKLWSRNLAVAPTSDEVDDVVHLHQIERAKAAHVEVFDDGSVRLSGMRRGPIMLQRAETIPFS